jgi:hypothetical protein
MFLM